MEMSVNLQQKVLHLQESRHQIKLLVLRQWYSGREVKSHLKVQGVQKISESILHLRTVLELELDSESILGNGIQESCLSWMEEIVNGYK